jgi:hypothetical protein
MKPYPLNSIEKNMLAWDREGLAFNSHLVADFSYALDEELLKNAAIRIFKEIPLLRTIIQNNKRFVKDNFTIPENFLSFVPISEKVEKEFLCRPFKLDIDSPLRIIYGALSKEKNTWRLIMTVHHSSFDGVAQSYLFRELFLAYQGLPLTAWTTKIFPFRYRDLFFKKYGITKSSIIFFYFLKDMFTQKTKAATLMTHPENLSRKVNHEIIELGNNTVAINARAKKNHLTFYETIFFHLLRALDQSIPIEDKKPIILAIPMNYRTILRVDHFFQNVVGLIKINFTREEVKHDNLAALLKKRLKEGSLPQLTLKTVFLAALTTKLIGITGLRKKMYENDINPDAIYATALVSALRTSPSIMGGIKGSLIPRRIYGHVSLFKSPGLGIIISGTRENQILVIEYLEDLFTASDILRFREALVTELALDL